MSAPPAEPTVRKLFLYEYVVLVKQKFQSIDILKSQISSVALRKAGLVQPRRHMDELMVNSSLSKLETIREVVLIELRLLLGDLLVMSCHCDIDSML